MWGSAGETEYLPADQSRAWCHRRWRQSEREIRNLSLAHAPREAWLADPPSSPNQGEAEAA